MSGPVVVTSARAFRLAWFDGEQYQASRYGYFEPHAAEVAAPTLNRARCARVRPVYTHLVSFEEDRVVEVRPLPEAA